MVLPRLYAIVDRATLDAHGMCAPAFARSLCEAGVRLVQYRDKVNAPQEILRACAEIAAAFDGVDATLILNDRADLAVLAGWDGVHVGQGDLTVEAARRVMDNPTHRAIRLRDEWGTREIQGSLRSAPFDSPAACSGAPVEMTEFKGLVGVSTHNAEQVRTAVGPMSQNRDMGHPDPYPDYIAVGPVFATSTKTDAEPVIGLEGVRRARTLTKRPIVAIGGITRENARSVIEAGADAVAVISGLIAEERPTGELVKDFLAALQ